MKHGNKATGSVGGFDSDGLAMDLRERLNGLMTKREQVVGREMAKSYDGFRFNDL